MPGETKIKRSAQGWYDVDNPTAYYRTRVEVRDIRRGTARVVMQTRDKPNQWLTITPTPGSPDSLLSGLQARLLDRLTQQQGVDLADALSVITSNGHNKAASYGHMREAGANHSEALFVINLGSPAVSLAYGKAREFAFDHSDALKGALDDYGD